MSRSVQPSLAELEAGLALVAYIVLRHGDVYAPLLVRMEREVAEARSRVSLRERAEQILAALPTREVTLALAS